MLIYPRLPRGVALELIVGQHSLDLKTLREHSSLSHPRAAPVATGGTRASEQILRHLAETVREVAEGCGWPGPLRSSEFDAMCALQLHEVMQIVPADAANEGVWSFITCVMLPDVAVWRFRERTPDRLLGMYRNTFRRLWWRAEILGYDLRGERILQGLGEDELVQVMERPSLSGNRRIARQLCESFLQVLEERPDLPRMLLMRESAKRLLRLTPFVCLGSLDDSDLRVTIEGAIRAAAGGLSEV